MKKIIFSIALFFAIATMQTVKAQYPSINDSVKHLWTEKGRVADSLSDIAWAKALPIVEKEEREGKPYVFWAARPTDLPQADIPAFPGAMGGGAYSFGGRGGKVIVVTTLNDSGPGSFREACETGGARIVVFNVAGVIHLKSPIRIRAPYITIAGQTAPGDGICIAGCTTEANTHDVVVRYMRFRRGSTDAGIVTMHLAAILSEIL